jgi:hypothetical protein
MPDGTKIAVTEGTPQGGPLSPLLSNIVLDELDRELQRRGHRFVRYAEDCNIFVRSARAGKRVMASIRSFLERRMRLKVNEEKSGKTRPNVRMRPFESLVGFDSPNRMTACAGAPLQSRQQSFPSASRHLREAVHAQFTGAVEGQDNSRSRSHPA